MVISGITISRNTQSSNRLRGYASIVLDNMLVIHDIKIIESQENLFIGMPSKEVKTKTYRDIAHPINKDVRDVVEKLIFAAYKEAVASGAKRLDWKLKEEAEGLSFYELSEEHYELAESSEQDIAV